MSLTLIAPNPFWFERSKLTWPKVREGTQVLYVGSDCVLFFGTHSGYAGVFPFDYDAPAGKDPFKAAVSETYWNQLPERAGDRPFRGSRLVWLGNGRLLEQQARAGGPGAMVRIWDFQPTRKPALAGTKPVYEEPWTSLTDTSRLVYLGGDLLMNWHRVAPTHSHCEVYRYERNNPAKPFGSYHSKGPVNFVGSDHELHYLGNDRVLVWRPRAEKDEREPDRLNAHWTVREVIRTRSANDIEVLPARKLAEGLDDKIVEGHDLVFVAEKRLIDWIPKTGDVRVWDIKNDIPLFVTPPGVKVVNRGGRMFLEVRVPQLIKGTPPTILGLGQKLSIPPEQVLQDLLTLPDNQHAARALYAERDELRGRRYPGQHGAAVELKRLATRPTATEAGDRGRPGLIFYTKTPSDGWGVKVTEPVRLTLTPAYRDVLQKQSAVIRAQEDTLRPLEERLKAIQDKTELLMMKVRGRRGVVKRNAEGLAYLNMMEGLCRTMIDRPAEPWTAENEGRKADVDALWKHVQRLISEHGEHLLAAPKDEVGARNKRELDQLAAELKAMLVDRETLRQAAFVAEHLESIDYLQGRHVYDVARNAYTTLLMTEAAEALVREQLEPTLQRLVGGVDTTGFQRIGVPAFDEEMARKKDFADSPPENLLEALTGPIARKQALSTGPQVIGGAPGPMSLLVIVYAAYAPYKLGKAVQDGTKVLTAVQWEASRLVKLMCWLGDLTKEDKVTLSTAMARKSVHGGRPAPDLEAIRTKVKWGERMQTGAAWSAGLAIVSACSLAIAIQAKPSGEVDPLTSLKAWSDIFASGGAGLSNFVQMIQKLLEWAEQTERLAAGASKVAQEVLGKIAVGLGVLAGMLGIVSSAVSFYQEFDSGDTVGATYAAVGGVSATISTLCFIAGVTAATGVGLIILAGAAAAGIAVGVAGAIRDTYTEATHGVFEMLLDRYKGSTSHLLVPDGVTSYHQAFGAVKSNHHPGWLKGFMTLVAPYPDVYKPGEYTVGGMEYLSDSGMPDELVAICVGHRVEGKPETKHVKEKLAVSRPHRNDPPPPDPDLPPP